MGQCPDAPLGPIRGLPEPRARCLNATPAQTLHLLGRGEPAPPLRAAAGWARHLGLAANLTSHPPSPAASSDSLLVDVSSLAAAGAAPDLNQLAPGVPPTRIILLARDALPATQAWLRTATRGAVPGVSPSTGNAQLSFHTLPPGAGGELSGAVLPRDSGPVLALATGPQSTTLLSTAAHSLWLRVAEGPITGLHIWSCPRVLDPEQRITTEKEIEGLFEAVLPLLAFLRGVHGNACWHNPHRHLGIVIDDPLLEPRYGCLDFTTLLATSRRIGLHVTLAFIPWNAWQTRTEDAAPFRAQPDVFSLCLHGCDHTSGEYSATDPELLRTLNAEALRRMEGHAARTGLATQPLMVCPQERFSRAALGTLAAEPGIEAVVNSRFLPRDHQRGTITAADLLRPAFTGYHGCTLIKRFYPNETWKLALARFLGQPALLVEHHAYFRSGTGPLEQDVALLRAADPGFTSPPITDVVRRTHWRRTPAPGQLELLVLTRRLDFQVEGPGPTQVTLLRPLSADVDLAGVQLDGREVAFQRTKDLITVHLPDLPPGEHQFEVRLVTPPPARPYRPSMSRRAGIALRRVVSEFRDRVLAREVGLLRFAQHVAKMLRIRA